MFAQTTLLVAATQSDPVPAAVSASCPAQLLPPQQRQELALQVLAGSQPVAQLARQHQVSRQFLYRQADTAQLALEHAFDPPPPTEEVLFQLPVTKSWLRQLILALVLTCHSSYRGVIALLGDLFDTPLSLGTVHNVVQAAVAPARAINGSYDLAGVRVGAHDEIFQAGRPVLVGVDTASTFCYLLSQEEHRDADTWGVRLLELAERGFAPEAIVADFGTGLRAGQGLALPAGPLSRRCLPPGPRPRAGRSLTWRTGPTTPSRPAHGWSASRPDSDGRAGRRTAWPSDCGGPAPPATRPSPWRTRSGCWGSGSATTCWRWPGRATPIAWCCMTSSWRELRARVASCPHRLGPIYRLLKNRRDDLLAFARALDEELGRMAGAWEVAPEGLRRLLQRPVP